MSNQELENYIKKGKGVFLNKILHFFRGSFFVFVFFTFVIYLIVSIDSGVLSGWYFIESSVFALYFMPFFFSAQFVFWVLKKIWRTVYLGGIERVEGGRVEEKSVAGSFFVFLLVVIIAISLFLILVFTEGVY